MLAPTSGGGPGHLCLLLPLYTAPLRRLGFRRNFEEKKIRNELRQEFSIL
jgi:hypothetical protein